MSEPDTTKSSSPSPSTPPFQFQPPTPEIPPRFSPTIAERMQRDTCFRCHQVGHWAINCPNSPNSKPSSSSPVKNDSSSISIKRIFCRCGHGICEVKTSRTLKNPGRYYYACPIARGAKCPRSGYPFVKWCDEDIDESYLQPPEFKYPECRCKAGVCKRVKESDSEGFFFICPVQLEHGSCGYRVSENEVRNIESSVPIRRSRQRTIHDLWQGLQKGDADNDMCNGYGIEGELLVKTKRMRITDNCESSSPMAVPEGEDVEAQHLSGLKEPMAHEGEDGSATPKAAESNFDSFPEFELDDDDLTWDAVAEEALSSLPTSPGIQCQQSESQEQNRDASLSNDDVEDAMFPNLSTPSAIRSRQSEFQRDILEASLSSFSLDWIGRLLFFHQMPSLKSPKPQPFFCCVFPSFDPIVVPKQVSIPNDPCKYNQLTISSLNSHTQIPNGIHSEVSRDVVSPDKSPGNERKPVPDSQIHKDVVSFMHRRLFTILESSDLHQHESMRKEADLHQHESMRKEAETTFAMLENLGIDYCKQFSGHVWDFINLASSIAELDKSMESSLTLEEHHKLLEEGKGRLAHIHNECVNNEAILEACTQQKQLLSKEVSHLESMLHEKQNQLKSCELETSKIATRLDDLRRRKCEADITLNDRAERAEEAWKRHQERKEKHTAAKIAFEKAKVELEN